MRAAAAAAAAAVGLLHPAEQWLLACLAKQLTWVAAPAHIQPLMHQLVRHSKASVAAGSAAGAAAAAMIPSLVARNCHVAAGAPAAVGVALGSVAQHYTALLLVCGLSLVVP